jgi:hypothetical protein
MLNAGRGGGLSAHGLRSLRGRAGAAYGGGDSTAARGAGQQTQTLPLAATKEALTMAMTRIRYS